MRVKIAWAMVLCVLLGTGLPTASAQDGSSDVLAGTSWQLVSFGSPGAETPVLPGSTVTLTFESGGQAGGNAGCNSYGGSYGVGGDTITFGALVTTRMACADAGVMQQEQAYLDTLRTAARFDLQPGALSIEYGGGQLYFAPVGPAPTPQVAPFENLDSPVGLLASYYNALNRGEHERAYGYWETAPNSFEDFVSGFAATTSIQVIVQPPARYEGAAGSTYVSIPTVLLAQHSDGTLLTFAGCFVTRKSNLMPPDIPEPDVWHLYSADVSEVPNDSAIPVLLSTACPE